MTSFFLHGLDSSNQGTKARYFKTHFPSIHIPNFDGPLEDRLIYLEKLCQTKKKITFIGSSYGGLLATVFAIRNPAKIHQLFLLAPALNFPDYNFSIQPQLDMKCRIFIGKDDDVTPIAHVKPIAEMLFANLTFQIVEDDHLLHNTFQFIDWPHLLKTA